MSELIKLSMRKKFKKKRIQIIQLRKFNHLKNFLQPINFNKDIFNKKMS